MSKYMKKHLLSFSLFLYCLPALSVDVDSLKLDAAKRASCSKNAPCSINSKSHNGTFIVKVNSVKISESGAVNINPYEYRRFMYNNGVFSHEITTK